MELLRLPRSGTGEKGAAGAPTGVHSILSTMTTQLGWSFLRATARSSGSLLTQHSSHGSQRMLTSEPALEAVQEEDPGPVPGTVLILLKLQGGSFDP